MKKNILALMCAASMVLFSACDKSNGNGGEGGSGSALQGKWITSQQQLADFPGDSKNNECWEYKVFCDGTVIGTEYIWNTEALIQYMIKQSMDGEIKAYGEVRKKYMYTKVEEPTEAACESRVWEGAVCLLETISWTDSLGHQQSQSEYCWIPEKNMQERHDYYMSVMKPAEEARGKINFKHEWARTEFTDRDACWANNPNDTTIVPPTPTDTTDYSRFDSINEKCWLVTQQQVTLTIQSYLWMTELDLVRTLNKAGMQYNYEPADAADEDACRELQEELERQHDAAKSCWKVDGTVNLPYVGPYSTTEYIWGTQEEANAAAEAIRQAGGTASVTKTSDADEDACYSHDQN